MSDGKTSEQVIKRNSAIRTICIAALIVMIVYVSFNFGAYTSCKNSGGTLLQDLSCTNLSAVPDCKDGNRYYFFDEQLPEDAKHIWESENVSLNLG